MTSHSPGCNPSTIVVSEYGSGSELREIYVTYESGSFRDELGPPNPRIASYFADLGLMPGDGCYAEVNLDAVDWIVDQDKVMYTIVIATVWQASGLVMALMLAGLRGIDDEIWKAARLDGIPAWRVYLSIVLPMLGPTVATVFLLLSSAVVKLFDAVVAMTQGGPGTASEVPAKFIMDHLFLRSNIGLASAGAIVMLVPVLALLAPYAYARSRRRRA